jgi:hypothetical protein
MRSIKAIALALVGVTVSACETMSPATYSNFGDNSLQLRMYSSAKLVVAGLEDESKFNSGCRLVGPITASGNRTIPQFVQDSFNEELKFAGIYSNDQGSAKLKLTLVSASFSSTSNLTSGWWDFTVKLDNAANNRSLTASSKYEFQSGFNATVACQNTSQALTPAVQRLINSVVSNPGFRPLITP